VRDLQDRLPVHEKGRAEQLIADARQALQDEAGIDRLRPLIADLQQLLHALPASAASAAGAGAREGEGTGSGEDNGHAESEDEEVIDAEFTRD
jgi:molecular chaperone DnaK